MDAQAAASYMDMKAGLISEKEYEKLAGRTIEVEVHKDKTLVG